MEVSTNFSFQKEKKRKKKDEWRKKRKIFVSANWGIVSFGSIAQFFRKTKSRRKRSWCSFSKSKTERATTFGSTRLFSVPRDAPSHPGSPSVFRRAVFPWSVECSKQDTLPDFFRIFLLVRRSTLQYQEWLWERTEAEWLGEIIIDGKFSALR